jgi:hypothetical protein
MKYSPYKPVRPRSLTVRADPTQNAYNFRSEGPEQRQPASPYDRSLNRSAVTWLHDLPTSVRPREAPVRFPRILNRLARFWDTPAMIETVFDELLVDRRVGRKGFPPEILAEIRALYVFHKSRLPQSEPTDKWISVPDRGRQRR